jgi:hypothetical protein
MPWLVLGSLHACYSAKGDGKDFVCSAWPGATATPSGRRPGRGEEPAEQKGVGNSRTAERVRLEI